jgi:hypothetical protein
MLVYEPGHTHGWTHGRGAFHNPPPQHVGWGTIMHRSYIAHFHDVIMLNALYIITLVITNTISTPWGALHFFSQPYRCTSYKPQAEPSIIF